jgi:hypothetical protein
MHRKLTEYSLLLELTTAGTLEWDLSDVPSVDISEGRGPGRKKFHSANVRVQLVLRDNKLEAVLSGISQEICRASVSL